MRSRAMAAGLAAVVLLGFAACAKPAKIQVSPPKVELRDAGATAQLSATVQDAKGNPMKAAVAYSSTKSAVADVDASGKVSAYGSGDAEIVVTCEQVAARVPVTVRIVQSIKLGLAQEADTAAAGPANSTYALKVTATDEAGQPADLSKAAWSSSDPKVATVDNKGVLTLLSNGKTEISVRYGKAAACTFSVPVAILVPMAIKLDQPALSLKMGESAPLAFTVLSNAGSPMTATPTFTSSNPKVAAVDEKGTVTGVSRGAAQITIAVGESVNAVTVSVR